MAAMPGTKQALEYARHSRTACFGLHLALTSQHGRAPVSHPSSVRSLVDANGALLPFRAFRRRLVRRAVEVADLEREISAQLQLLRDAGVPPRHLDSHRHVHKYRPVVLALTNVLPSFGVKYVRGVQDVFFSPPVFTPGFWLGPLRQRRIATRFCTTDHFYMPRTALDSRWAVQILKRDRSGTLEIGVHPGRNEEWRLLETQETLALAEHATRLGHILRSWSDLPAAPRRRVTAAAPGRPRALGGA